MEPLLEYKNIARGLWAAGDYDLMARTEGLYVTGDHLVRAAGISGADHVLDVACGRRRPARSSCTPPNSARWPPPARPPRPTAGGPRCGTR